MTKESFLKSMVNPIPGAILKKHPQGHIFQLWGENPELYSQAFGFRDDLHYYLGGHSGLDIGVYEGAEVVACFDGKVLQAGGDPKALGGIMVWIESPVLIDGSKQIKIQAVCGHLKDVSVYYGQEVKAGELIGHQGNTGFVASGGVAYWGNAPAGKGVHTHFGLYEYVLDRGSWIKSINNPMGGSFDPLPWLTGDWSGSIGVLQNMLRFLANFLKGRE